MSYDNSKREALMSDTDLNEFEKELNQLESIVNQLEKGDLPLETSLSCFEEGIRLAQRCQTALNEAEQRIEKLTSALNKDQPQDD
jgi:exodeoxyribonuclease VII small subunit